MVIVYEINACRTVFALSDAVVNIFGTRRATPTVQACTHKCTRRVFAQRCIDARTQIRRRIRFAFIYVCRRNRENYDCYLFIVANISCQFFTANLRANRCCERVLTDLAYITGPFGRAFATKATNEIYTSAAMFAWTSRAFIDVWKY